MSGFRRVLCGTDLSVGSDSAILAAHREARLHGAELILVHVLPATFPGTQMFPEVVEQSLLDREAMTSRVMEAMLDRLGRLTRRDAGTASFIVDDGLPDEALIRNADERGADLIVVGATGASGHSHRHFGGTATKVVKHAHASVLVTRSRTDTGRLLLALDFSEASDEAARVAAQEAQQRCAQIIALHSLEDVNSELFVDDPGFFVTADPQMREVARTRISAMLEPLDAHPQIEIVEGSPASVIVQTALEKEVDLIVVGTSRRSGIDRLLLGGISTKVVREASCSVLVVRPRAVSHRSTPSARPDHTL